MVNTVTLVLDIQFQWGFHQLSEQFLNGTSAHYRLFSATNGG